MEVADQWRREWSGTAEYGKVSEGGVTRRIARAMEVLHASAPGARVRVLRAAYHSSAGPGAAASSYMLHSSRRVISSGFNFLEPPTTPNKPLELCSMPLESSPEPNGDVHGYKVTEPDDIEISEPSKWRGSTGTGSVRMPSEESSSTDNASIIDLTSNKHFPRKYSYDSENSDNQWVKRGSARASPLLDAPVTLSTLKYKSLLNGSTEWNHRRKSYSFEDTSPINESILHSNDTLAMESSTDSGICKSSEIVNDHINENINVKPSDREERRSLGQDESFKDWLTKKRQTSYKRNHFKTHRNHDVVIENPSENNITLQSTGKVSITLPITIETDDDDQFKPTNSSEDGDRKVKKVEFCKTEVHFAAESGKVNIIATDEKPPPSNDFRKRRSAFVPLNDMMEKHITLFGEKTKEFLENNSSDPFTTSISEFDEADENTAATKSILKNKIPKPKPYLLGENMVFGFTNDEHTSKDNQVLTAVSLINRQLQSEKLYSNEITTSLSRKPDQKTPNFFRTIDEGPSKIEDLHATMNTQIRKKKFESNLNLHSNNKLKNMQKATNQERLKTRELRDSDLTYFGVDAGSKQNTKVVKNIEDRFTSTGDSTDENIFRSVRLIQQVSNSVCNSECESEDAHEYQNVPLIHNYTPKPAPRRSAMHSKYDDKPNEVYEIQMLNPIIEQDNVVVKENVIPTPRRSKLRKYEETISTSRSISEPPKNNNKYNSTQKSHRNDHLLRGSKTHGIKDHDLVNRLSPTKTSRAIKLMPGEPPVYENIDIDIENTNSMSKSTGSSVHKTDRSEQRRSRNKSDAIKTSNIDVAKKSQRSRSSNDSNKIKPIPRKSQNYDRTTEIKSERIQIPNSKITVDTPTSQIMENNTRVIKTKSNVGRDMGKSDDNKLVEGHKANVRSHLTPTITSNAKSSKGTSSKADKITPDISSLKRTDSRERHKITERSTTRKSSPRKESTKTVQNLDPNTACEPSLIKLNPSDRKSTYKDSLNGHIAPKRNEYVINYDDKNGTVSSIRKIKGPLSSKKKKISKEIPKEMPKDNTVRNKAFAKTALR